jgi:hypothetical protein
MIENKNTLRLTFTIIAVVVVVLGYGGYSAYERTSGTAAASPGVATKPAPLDARKPSDTFLSNWDEQVELQKEEDAILAKFNGSGAGKKLKELELEKQGVISILNQQGQGELTQIQRDSGKPYSWDPTTRTYNPLPPPVTPAGALPGSKAATK